MTPVRRLTGRVIPTTWTAHHRSSDDELVGYLRADGELVTPLTLAGTPLAEPREAEAAIAELEARGLAALAERWTLDRDGEQVDVRVLSARPDAVVVVEAPYGYPQPGGRRWELDVPTEGLRPRGG